MRSGFFLRVAVRRSVPAFLTVVFFLRAGFFFFLEAGFFLAMRKSLSGLARVACRLRPRICGGAVKIGVFGQGDAEFPAQDGREGARSALKRSSPPGSLIRLEPCRQIRKVRRSVRRRSR